MNDKSYLEQGMAIIDWKTWRDIPRPLRVGFFAATQCFAVYAYYWGPRPDLFGYFATSIVSPIFFVIAFPLTYMMLFFTLDILTFFGGLVDLVLTGLWHYLRGRFTGGK